MASTSFPPGSEAPGPGMDEQLLRGEVCTIGTSDFGEATEVFRE